MNLMRKLKSWYRESNLKLLRRNPTIIQLRHRRPLPCIVIYCLFIGFPIYRSTGKPVSRERM